MTDETLKSRQISYFNTDTICLKGKAHHTDYPKLAAIEYEIIQYGEWFFPWHQVSKEGGKVRLRRGKLMCFPHIKFLKKLDMDLKTHANVVN